MAEKESRTVSTLSEFLEWAAQFNDGQYLFRGVKKEDYEMIASASRHLQGSDGTNPSKLLKLNKRLIEDARSRGHDQKDGRTLSNLELLAELQHFGAATCLIDFTRSALVALWFACESGTKEENDANGKVVAVRRDIWLITVTSDLVQNPIDHFFQIDDRDQYKLYQWEPKLQNYRIIAQHSVFLFGGAKVKVEAKCVIVRSSKRSILKSLNEVSDISEASMYPDFYGFARLHAHDRPYDEPDARGYLRRGIEADRRGDYCDAISYYNKAISLDSADDFIVTQAYYNRGVAYAKYGDLSSAVGSYTKAIERDSYFTDAYFNRGVAYDKMDDDVHAIEDFTIAINLNPTVVAIYHTRGITFYRKRDFNRAIEDFSMAIEQNPNYVKTYSARGMAHLHLQAWREAQEDLMTARSMGANIINDFCSQYKSVNTFENITGVKLPEDIVALLTPAQT